jgi:hypothetical protein
MPLSSFTDHIAPEVIKKVRALDPLLADRVCRDLPVMNDQGAVPDIVAALRGLVPELSDVSAYSVHDCLAAMRDVGMFLGSLKRHSVEPTGIVPEVVPLLLELGRRTDMIPRDTVHHYTTWNPLGGRQRMYTGDVQEASLQLSVRLVLPHVRAGLELCDLLGEIAPDDPRFAQVVDELTQHLGAMVKSIDLVAKNVSPVFFARTLRAYFEGVMIDGKTYLGPAAAQVPLWLIDQAVWASDGCTPEYAEFIRDAAPYGLPRWRDLYSVWRNRPSLVTRLIRAYGKVPGEAECRSPALRASAEALAQMLRVVIVFRGRHLGIARQTYQADLQLYPKGSGGSSVGLLRQILDLTRESALLTKMVRATPQAQHAKVDLVRHRSTTAIPLWEPLHGAGLRTPVIRAEPASPTHGTGMANRLGPSS